MLKCLFVVDRSVNTSVVDTLVRALTERGVGVSLVDPGRVTVRVTASTGRLDADPSTEPGTVVIHRNVMEWTAIVRLASEAWVDSGATVLNDVSSSIRSRNKFEASLTLARAGVPVLDSTAFTPSATGSWPQISEPSVVKPACGARGVGVARVGPEDRWVEPVEEMPASYRPYWLVQREIRTGGSDLRAFVVDGECVALMRRVAVGDEWRANVFLGAVCERLDPSGAFGDLAVSAVKGLGLDYASVDMFDVDGVTFVNEVDPWGGFSAISDATGVDVAAVIADRVVAAGSGRP